MFVRVDGRIRISRVFDENVASHGAEKRGAASPRNKNHAHVKSPLGGAVVSIKVKIGDSVKAGDILAVINVMKVCCASTVVSDPMLRVSGVFQ